MQQGMQHTKKSSYQHIYMPLICREAVMEGVTPTGPRRKDENEFDSLRHRWSDEAIVVIGPFATADSKYHATFSA
jgi:hypothetical protein